MVPFRLPSIHPSNASMCWRHGPAAGCLLCLCARRVVRSLGLSGAGREPAASGVARQANMRKEVAGVIGGSRLRHPYPQASRKRRAVLLGRRRGRYDANVRPFIRSGVGRRRHHVSRPRWWLADLPSKAQLNPRTGWAGRYQSIQRPPTATGRTKACLLAGNDPGVFLQ